MKLEQTLIVIKPDGVNRKLVGEILSRFEKKGFDIVKLKMLTMTQEQAEAFYALHKGKPFFYSLVKFMTSGPIVAAVLEGDTSVAVVRLLVGATKSFEADAGTIRGDYGLGIKANIIHASDSRKSFTKEVQVIFP